MVSYFRNAFLEGGYNLDVVLIGNDKIDFVLKEHGLWILLQACFREKILSCELRFLFRNSC